jgi:hypothetical protein
MDKQEFKKHLADHAPHWKADHIRLTELDIHDNVTRVMEEYSGGGQWHLMFHLDDGRVINFATWGESVTEGDIEISYGKWKTLGQYFAAEEPVMGEGPGGGFGWEYTAPHYDRRILPWDSGMKRKVKALIKTKF